MSKKAINISIDNNTKINVKNKQGAHIGDKNMM